MITPQDQFLTSGGPMKEWFDRARALEQQPGVLDVSPYPMQPWLDVAEGGWAVVVHTEDDAVLADQLAAEMGDLAWELRAAFWQSERVEVAEAVRRAYAHQDGLLVLSDTGDSVYGGAPGDSTWILRELLRQAAGQPETDRTMLVPIVDRAAVDVALAAGVGAEITVSLGGKIDQQFNQPVSATGTVVAVSERYQADIEERGSVEVGGVALLQVGPVYIAVLASAGFAICHPILYQHLGLEIERARAVVVKTASNFQYFAPWRKDLIRVDSPGMTQSDLAAFTWTRTPRPIYPFDVNVAWDAAAAGSS